MVSCLKRLEKLEWNANEDQTIFSTALHCTLVGVSGSSFKKSDFVVYPLQAVGQITKPNGQHRLYIYIYIYIYSSMDRFIKTISIYKYMRAFRYMRLPLLSSFFLSRTSTLCLSVCQSLSLSLFIYLSMGLLTNIHRYKYIYIYIYIYIYNFNTDRKTRYKPRYNL